MAEIINLDLDKLGLLTRLKFIKVFKNWSSYELAQKLGVTPATVSRWENKKNSVKNYKVIYQKTKKLIEEIMQELGVKKNI